MGLGVPEFGGYEAVIGLEVHAQLSDEAELRPIIERVLDGNAIEVERYRAGKHGLLASFVGQL